MTALVPAAVFQFADAISILLRGCGATRQLAASKFRRVPIEDD